MHNVRTKFKTQILPHQKRKRKEWLTGGNWNDLVALLAQHREGDNRLLAEQVVDAELFVPLGLFRLKVRNVERVREREGEREREREREGERERERERDREKKITLLSGLRKYVFKPQDRSRKAERT